MEDLASNIARFRKRRGLTQRELADRLNVSFQAVSKWENGLTSPDVATLGDLAAALDADPNRLLGYPCTGVGGYEETYKAEGLYWGAEPSAYCFEAMRLAPARAGCSVLDVGCGEGKDAVFFARNGYAVDAFDIAPAGIEKARRLAASCGAKINAFVADVLDYRLQRTYDIVFCSGVLHYVPPALRAEVIADYQAHTNAGGVHVLNVFVPKPFIAAPPEDEPDATAWTSGELASHYTDWLIREMSEIVFDCDSSGVRHQHCMDVLVAQKPV